MIFLNMDCRSSNCIKIHELRGGTRRHQSEGAKKIKTINVYIIYTTFLN